MNGNLWLEWILGLHRSRKEYDSNNNTWKDIHWSTDRGFIRMKFVSVDFATRCICGYAFWVRYFFKCHKHFIKSHDHIQNLINRLNIFFICSDCFIYSRFLVLCYDSRLKLNIPVDIDWHQFLPWFHFVSYINWLVTPLYSIIKKKTVNSVETTKYFMWVIVYYKEFYFCVLISFNKF